MIDGGGGNMILHQLKSAGFDWKEMRDIFVTHKHIDHLLGIIWMMRMILQNMNRGTYDGEATIYGHEEVIAILEKIAGEVLSEKETKNLGKRLHMVVVEDGEEREIIGKPVTFFDIHSTKAKQFGFSMELEPGKKLTCCGDEPYNEAEKVEIHEMDNGEFDYRVSFADDPEDSYIYCFKDEGCHIIYHRFLPEDYADFAF